MSEQAVQKWTNKKKEPRTVHVFISFGDFCDSCLVLEYAS